MYYNLKLIIFFSKIYIYKKNIKIINILNFMDDHIETNEKYDLISSYGDENSKIKIVFPKLSDYLNNNIKFDGIKNIPRENKKIFGESINFTQQEIDTINNLKQSFYINNELISNNQLLRYCYFYKLKLERIKQAINNYIKIYQHIKQIQIFTIYPLFTIDMIYLNGYDLDFHPNLFINLSKLIKIAEKYKNDIISDYFLYLFYIIINNVVIPGKVETINILIDFDNVNNFIINKEIKNYLLLIQNIFPYRFNKIFLLNINEIDTVTVKFYLLMFHQTIRNNIEIIKKDDIRKLEKYIDKNLLEKKYSGRLGKLSHFSIQIYNQNNSSLSSENKEDHSSDSLLSVNNYKNI